MAGFWRRLGADFVDLALLAALVFPFGYLFRYPLSELGGRGASVGLVLSIGYFGALHTKLGRGQTLGKRVLQIQVLRRDGRFFSGPRSFSRYLLTSLASFSYGALLFPLGPRASEVASSTFQFLYWPMVLSYLIMIPLHPLKLGLQDVLTDSIVVRTGRYDSAALARLDDPKRTRLAVVLTALASVVVLSLSWLVPQWITSDSRTRLLAIRDDLARSYELRDVRDMTFSSTKERASVHVLRVMVHVPLRTMEDKRASEQLRAEIRARISKVAQPLSNFREVKVVLLSGVELGVMHWTKTD
ncbi:MAG: domain containing protein [Myxococcaceae bacterium]|nr:domain containing protein [Myxococcaceae bacterium]